MRERDEIFVFERGAFFSGQLCYKIIKTDGKYIFSGRGMNAFYRMKRIEFELPENELNNLYKVLEAVCEWKAEYKPDAHIFDGYGWSLYFCHEGDRIESHGYEAYPSNYKKVIKGLQEYIENICAKYDSNYETAGLEKRLAL